jgi:hypothetical protein
LAGGIPPYTCCVTFNFHANLISRYSRQCWLWRVLETKNRPVVIEGRRNGSKEAERGMKSIELVAEPGHAAKNCRFAAYAACLLA